MAKRAREEHDAPSSSSPTDLTDLEEAIPKDGFRPRVPILSTTFTSKIVHLDPAELHQNPKPVMECSLPPHRTTESFASFEEYDTHYAKYHVNRCVECRKNFPTPHFLSLHQAECHNPLIQVLRDRGEKTFECFVEGCDRNCSTAQKRRLHLIDKHMFPKNYDFRIVNDGVDHKTSMLKADRRRRKDETLKQDQSLDNKHTDPMPVTIPVLADQQGGKESQIVTGHLGEPRHTVPEMSTSTPDDELQELTSAMSSLKFIPPSVRFGRRTR